MPSFRETPTVKPARMKAQSKPVSEDEITEMAELYAQRSCQLLCDKVINRIPRELRDLIYQHLVMADYIYVGPQYLSNRGQPCKNESSARHWDVKYVGRAMLVELVQIWYRQSMFYFWDTKRNDEVIKSFMTSDRWGLHIKPFEYISKVRFDLVDDVLHYHQLGEKKAKCTVAEQYPVRLTAPFKVFARSRFPPRVNFTICIHTFGSLKSGCLSSIDLHHTLDEILKDLRVLHSAGHGFTLQWSELEDCEFVSDTCSLSVELWERKICDNLQQRGWK